MTQTIQCMESRAHIYSLTFDLWQLEFNHSKTFQSFFNDACILYINKQFQTALNY